MENEGAAPSFLTSEEEPLHFSVCEPVPCSSFHSVRREGRRVLHWGTGSLQSPEAPYLCGSGDHWTGVGLYGLISLAHSARSNFLEDKLTPFLPHSTLRRSGVSLEAPGGQGDSGGVP